MFNERTRAAADAAFGIRFHMLVKFFRTWVTLAALAVAGVAVAAVLRSGRSAPAAPAAPAHTPPAAHPAPAAGPVVPHGFLWLVVALAAAAFLVVVVRWLLRRRGDREVETFVALNLPGDEEGDEWGLGEAPDGQEEDEYDTRPVRRYGGSR